MTKSDDIIKTALKRFKLAEDAEDDIRRLSLEDLKFRAGDQWPPNIKQGRSNDNKPCLTINRIPQFVRQITNDMRQNRPQLHIDATDDSTKETADILEGMVRQIQVSSNADIAFDTAADAQVTMGFGYFRIITDYVDHKSFDQEIKIARIKNAFTVYYDPYCTEPDYSDAKWCFIVSDENKSDFMKSYPDYSENLDFTSIGDTQPGWMTEDTIRVAEYFTVEEEDDTLYLLEDGKTFLKSELKDKAEVKDGQLISLQDGQIVGTVKNERKTSRRKVMWRKITAFATLEEREWAGKYIPVIPVLGDDLDIDGERNLIGMVRYAKDPQRMYNYWTSAETEAIALAPKAPFIIAEGQVEGYENLWKSANVRNWAYLPYKPTTIAGMAVSPPQRQTAEPPINAMVTAIAQASEDLKNTTGLHDASLGARGNETSGKAILARQREGDTANFHYMDNLSRAIKFMGVQLLDLIPKIYDAARIVRILHINGDSKTVKINQPSGEKDINGVDKIYDVTTGKYDVTVNVGPSFNTKRQEAVDTLNGMIQVYPQLMEVAGDLVAKSMDWEGSDELAERLKKLLPPQLQDNGDQKIPPQIKQELDKAHAMIEQLTGALNAAHDKLDIEEQKLASAERISSETNMAKIMTEIIKQESAANHKLLEAEIESLAARMGVLDYKKPVDSENDVDNAPIGSGTMIPQQSGGVPAGV